MNSSHQPFSLLKSAIGSKKQTLPKEFLLYGSSNWAVNQAGKGHNMSQMGVVARRQNRLKRSPREPPYWLNPENNLVVDDPPPPEVSALHEKFLLRFYDFPIP